MAHCTHCELNLHNSTQHEASTWLAPVSKLWHRLANGAGAWQRRRKLTQLQDLDDKMLQDIGVTRAELHRVTRLPLSVNAAVELQKLALSRRQREFNGEQPR